MYSWSKFRGFIKWFIMATDKTHPDNDPIGGEGTGETEYWFYQCVAPECNLRFPAPELKRMICPVCQTAVEKKESYKTGSILPSQKIPGSGRISVLLDNLRSAYNVGSILRTADGAGFEHAYLCGISPTPEQSKLAKTALTAEIHTSWSHHNNGISLIKELKDSGFSIICLETAQNAKNLFQFNWSDNRKAVLVVGNEIYGIDPAIQRLADHIVYLPMAGFKQSLNVAVSFGIAAYFFIHQHPVESEL